MTVRSEPLFLFGPGYSATALSELWQGAVYGTVRSKSSLAALEKTKIKPLPVGEKDALFQALEGAHLLISAPPSETGCQALQMLGEQTKRAASVTYLSTTGVYGDLMGGWVMEWSAVRPQSDRARKRAIAEAEWFNAHDQVRLVRLPGIYGPGRSALERVQSGKARRIVKPGQVFSRIHVEDIASGLYALLQSGAIGAFNLCDDEAAPPQDVIEFAANLLGVTPPPDIRFDEADLSPMGRSFYAECKRVANARIKAATGWRPKYPTYREGLSAIAAQIA
ncbi:MAG: SDR family NAD(P)-dependent oxidoreductase [Henriciella sp.]|nr:SDR family NAD(P)-dependent oxidoreductase [Henriciella sp.]